MMEKLKFLRFGTAVLSVAALFLVGCQEEETSVFEVNTDVVFLHKVAGNDTLTGVAYYVHGNQKITEATVTLPNDGGTVELEQHPNSSYTFFKEPADEDYKDRESVSTGSYVFDVAAGTGEMFEISDIQETDNLGFARLDSTGFDQTQRYYYFDWEEVPDAQSYVALLLDSSGEVIFTGYPVDDESPAYFLSTHYDFGTWETSPQKDENYTLRIQAYLYDSDATNYDYVYNIQEISIVDYPLVWELE